MTGAHAVGRMGWDQSKEVQAGRREGEQSAKQATWECYTRTRSRLVLLEGLILTQIDM